MQLFQLLQDEVHNLELLKSPCPLSATTGALPKSGSVMQGTNGTAHEHVMSIVYNYQIAG